MNSNSTTESPETETSDGWRRRIDDALASLKSGPPMARPARDSWIEASPNAGGE